MWYPEEAAVLAQGVQGKAALEPFVGTPHAQTQAGSFQQSCPAPTVRGWPLQVWLTRISVPHTPVQVSAALLTDLWGWENALGRDTVNLLLQMEL